MSVKQLLQEVDSREMASWWAYDQRWPIADPWQQTARLCRIIMASSGNFKSRDIPDEEAFIPALVKRRHVPESILAEMQKLNALK